MSASFSPGITQLIGRRRDWIAGRRVGLLSHQAAVDRTGRTTAELLRQCADVDLCCIFGPEHGYFGLHGAGERTRCRKHPAWGIPIHSLYGRQRRPTAAMLKDIDVLVIDLQDLGARCYTYVSTLRLALEAVTETGTPVVVADRPIPLPRGVDGPMLRDGFRSFVALVDTPLVYGMTPGETALWLGDTLGLDLGLEVARMRGYGGAEGRGADWPPWIPPSPGIRSWDSAMCYPATVFCEAIPAIDCGRSTNLSFQVLGAPWMKAEAVIERLDGAGLRGVAFRPHRFSPRSGPYAGKVLDGLRLVVTDPERFRPVATAIGILSALQELYGQRKVWRGKGVRPSFFDALFGTDMVRAALLDSDSPAEIAQRWNGECRAFNAARRAHLLYPRSQ